MRESGVHTTCSTNDNGGGASNKKQAQRHVWLTVPCFRGNDVRVIAKNRLVAVEIGDRRGSVVSYHT